MKALRDALEARQGLPRQTLRRGDQPVRRRARRPGPWNQVKSITVDAAITGALWALKNKADALKDVRF